MNLVVTNPIRTELWSEVVTLRLSKTPTLLCSGLRIGRATQEGQCIPRFGRMGQVDWERWSRVKGCAPFR
jgi:hypothetical protein